MRDDPPHYLLYDGDCDFCHQWAEWLSNRDAVTRRFRITPWQTAPSPPLTPLLQVQARKAVQVVTSEGKRLSGGRAVLFALRETGWHPTLARLLQHRPFVWAVDLGYRVVAANRPRFSWLAPH
jgi:predicted DCC family thiol-disulfide oxidoreductase YuxK